MKLANEIQKGLIDFARGHAYDIVLCNFYFGSYEMDLFKLNDKGWITEYEIKVSRADFKKDFEKSRKRFVWDSEEQRKYHYEKLNKHDELISGECRPNRFYFVVPRDLITVAEVPAHCGLIYYDGNFSIVKTAKLLHKNKQPEKIYKDICRSMAFRELRWRNEVIRLRNWNKYLEEDLSNALNRKQNVQECDATDA